MQTGELYVQAMPEHLTAVRDGSSLLPTPVVNDMGRGKTIQKWNELLAKWKAKHNNNGHGKSLSIELQKIMENTNTPSNDGNNSHDPHQTSSLTKTEQTHSL